MPYESLGLDAADVARLAGTPVPRVSRLGSLLSPFLSELADTASSSLPPVGELLAWNAVNVLATLATERLNRDATATPDARTPLRARILEFIDLHLTDENLSPETIAGAHHISARYLHRLFQDEGTTVGRWIQRQPARGVPPGPDDPGPGRSDHRGGGQPLGVHERHPLQPGLPGRVRHVAQRMAGHRRPRHAHRPPLRRSTRWAL